MVVRIVDSKGEWRVVPRYAGGQHDGSCVTRRACRRPGPAQQLDGGVCGLVDDHSRQRIVGESGGAHLISSNNSRGHGGGDGIGPLWGSLGASDSCHEDGGGKVGEVHHGSSSDVYDYVRWR